MKHSVTILKKIFAFLIILCVSVSLCACSVLPSANSQLASNSQSTYSLSSSTKAESSQQKSNQEPPLTKEDLEMPVPDFLNDEQKNLYLHMYKLFSVFEGETINIDILFPIPDTTYQNNYDNKEIFIDEITYYPVLWRYRNWDTFITMIYSLFDKNYFETHNVLMLNGVDFPHFREKDGITYFHNCVRGSHSGYDRQTMPETFRLISADENLVEFYVIGHYNQYSIDEITQERIITSTYTEEYHITMVNTENGWRFTEFHIPY